MHRLRDRAVLVAGGAGFVGSALVRELAGHGAFVVSYDNYLHGRPENLSGISGVVCVRGDTRDTESLTGILADHSVEYVFCCAGDTFVPTCYRLPGRFAEINIQGTLSVLRAAREVNVRRLLYLSSTEVYGECRMPRVDESAPLNPVNTYAVTKMAADRLCHTFALEHGLPVVIARLFNCYGPRESHPYVIPEIVSQLSRGPRVRLGNTRARRDLTYVHDTARALVRLMESAAADGEVVNVGSDTEYEVEWLTRLLARIMRVEDLVIEVDERRYRRRDIDRFRCDNRLLRRLTGWTPRVGVEEGMRRTVEWFEANGGRWSWEEPGREETGYGETAADARELAGVAGTGTD
ncbi:NAD-dependent epimerase/dehydratase family protein [Planobispora siamensis]|uniref:UDP-glucose 4-epimerase n=1 Tax=Planobispora siamensis TaxID=936338 RepID=A0A8J3SEV0_9ACTN|nr:NAD-dependent epimerase/dehydratase family protein [Planobispora siamensis]GIH92933.1 UDP-glucose 4-epimerase [Planobispora siamensis]